MATVRKNNKKKIITIICLVLVAALIATGVTIYVADSKIPQVSLYTIGTSDIYESINSTGNVTAGAVKSYSVGTVAVVKEVFVKLGDEVKKGDILATFDTSNYDEQIKNMEASYEQAKAGYNEALASQKEAKSNLDSVNKQIATLEKEIKQLEKKIADDIEAAQAARQTTAPTTTKPATTAAPTTTKPATTAAPTTTKPATTAAPTTTKPATTAAPTTTQPSATTTQPSATPASTFADAIAQLTDIIGGLSEDQRVNGVIVSVVLETVASELRKENTSPEAIASAVATAVNKAAGEGLIDAEQLAVDREAAVKAISEAVEGINWSGANQSITQSDLLQSIADSEAFQALAEGVTAPALDRDSILQAITDSEAFQALAEGVTAPALDRDSILQAITDSEALQALAESVSVPTIDPQEIIQSISESDSVKLASDRMTLSACYAQQQIYTSLASDALVDARKEVMNTTKSAVDALKEARQQLADGWTAAFDGVVTDCSIFPGEQTSMLSSGITIQNMDTMVVTISLGEYDIHKVDVDMPVTISSAYGTYSGKVISKAPVAGGGSSGSSSIVDSFGSMMGISGLSSLTDSGSGVEVKISVDDPDENIIVGFSAAVEIHIGEFLGVPTVPAESMLHDKNGTYVYVYNEEESTVTKTQIKTGAMSYTEYEVTSGLKEGDRIVYAPQSTFDETFEVKVAK